MCVLLDHQFKQERFNFINAFLAPIYLEKKKYWAYSISLGLAKVSFSVFQVTCYELE